MKEFFTINDLYFDLTKVDVKSYPNLQNIINKYNAAQGGCGCSRNTRVAEANNTYNNLSKVIKQEEVDFLCKLFSVGEIIFKSGNAELGRFKLTSQENVLP